MAIRVTMRIRGRVQGVFYRQSACEEAQRLGLVGWVRNLDDGSVEAQAEGPEEQVRRFQRWCQVGPSAARVASVEAADGPATGEYASFSVLR